jgi:MFS family permease
VSNAVPTHSEVPPAKPFAALALPGFKPFVITMLLTMMADNIEHVISYWVMAQKFHSASLGGFAVIAHWLPFLVFSVPVGALNDRFDSRRLIQIGASLFLLVSLGWGYFFVTDTLQIWHCMLLLVMHGCAGVFWMTSSQVLLYDIVGRDSIASAVRLGATARYMGMLVGPGVGSIIMRTLGPTRGMFVNCALYLPIIIWLISAPYGVKYRVTEALRRPVRGLRDILDTIGDVRRIPVLATMIILAGAASFFVGNSYQAQMPTFANDLGHGDPGAAYTMLLGADAAGALMGGLLLESGFRIFQIRTHNALRLAALWASSLCAFSLTGSYPLAIGLLFCAGFFELSFSSMTQTIVQLHAPTEIRGRVLGLFGMSSAGLRTFSGVMVGVLGSFATVHWSLAIAASALIVISVSLLLILPAAPPLQHK